MKVIAFVSQKGGVGKSTVVISCAVAAQSPKSKILIIDMDYQQHTAESWYQVRESETPQLIRIKSNQLQTALDNAEKNAFDYVFIDAPGRDDPGVNVAMRLADFCLIPCRPSLPDMKATQAPVEALNRLDKPFALVLTQTPIRGFRITDAKKGLQVLGTVSPVHITHRVDHQDAYSAGLGVTEYDPDGKAAAEIQALWQWLKNQLRKLT